MATAPRRSAATPGLWERLRQSEQLAFLDVPWKPVPLWAMIGWLLFYAWFLLHAWRTTARGEGPFLDVVNLVIHEAGHPLFGYLGQTMGVWGGTLLQLLVPAALAVTFLRMRELMGTTFCAFLFFENFLGIAIYMADARALDLPLLSAGAGPDALIGHDWNIIFAQLGVLHYDIRIAAAVRLLGFLGMVAVPLWFAWRSRQTQLIS